MGRYVMTTNKAALKALGKIFLAKVLAFSFSIIEHHHRTEAEHGGLKKEVYFTVWREL